MADLSFNELMTAHMDAIRVKANVTGKLSIAEATEAVNSIVINPPSGGVDVSGVTATASDVLNTVKFVDSTGTLKSGLIATVIPSVTDDTFTVQKGYVAENTTLTVEEAEAPTIEENIVTVYKGYNKTQKTVAVPEATITNDGEKISISVGYNKTAQQFNIGGDMELPDGITVQPADVRFDVTYIDANGQKQSGTMNELVASPIVIEEAGSHTLQNGYYEDCTIEVGCDTLDEINIRAGVNVMGVDGTFSADATATENDILDGKTAAVNGQMITGKLKASSGNSTVKFGYWTEDGKFQEVDLSGSSPVDIGSPIAVDAVTFDTGKPAPEYGGGDSCIDFYECTSYTPDFAGGLQYSLTLSGASKTEANGTYIRKKWVDPVDEASENYTTTAKWVNENNCTLTEEYGWGEYTYSIYDSSNNQIYTQDGPNWSRVTDYNQVIWADTDEWMQVTLTFSAWSTTELPPTIEAWSGYKMLQDTESGAWSRSNEFAADMPVLHQKPKVGDIYSADTSIRIRKMYDGAVYPITSDGLVFYAALQNDYVDTVSGQVATINGGVFTEHNGISCLELDGSEYVRWADNSDLPEGTVPYSFVVLVSPTNIYDWKCYVAIGHEGSDEICIHAKDGRLEEYGPSNIKADGNWYALAYTHDADGSEKTYINGKLDGSGTRQKSVPSQSAVYVGMQANGGGQNFYGYIAFAAIYNRVLTADEVYDIHNTLLEM